MSRDDEAMNGTTMQTKPETNVVLMPAPTAWPIVLAFGITLMFGGLVTSASVTVLGLLLSAVAAVGWFRNVLPIEAHETMHVDSAAAHPVPVSRRLPAGRVAAAEQFERTWLPLEIYPVSTGLKGGLAGAVVMALLAMTYGIVGGKGIWYPINLLAAGFFPGAWHHSTSEIAAFHLDSLLIASAIHLITAVLVGLLYGVTLPMLPRRPIVLGGLVAPVLWSGLVHSILGIVNPVMNAWIDWPWFVLSQIGFGIAAGTVVSRQERVRTWQRLPLAVRAGIEAPGLMRERDGGEP
jgi:hypothetical protein